MSCEKHHLRHHVLAAAGLHHARSNSSLRRTKGVAQRRGMARTNFTGRARGAGELALLSEGWGRHGIARGA